MNYRVIKETVVEYLKRFNGVDDITVMENLPEIYKILIDKQLLPSNYGYKRFWVEVEHSRQMVVLFNEIKRGKCDRQDGS